MKFEFLRIFRNRTVPVLLLALILCGWSAFYIRLTDSSSGYSFLDMADKCNSGVDISREVQELDVFVAEPGTYPPESYITGNPYMERYMDLQILNRNEEAMQYSQWLSEHLQELSMKIRSGLFGDESSFAVRALQKEYDVYKKLENTSVAGGFWGLEAVFQWNITDLICFLSALILSLFLILEDKTGGILQLQKTAVYGKGHLVKKKYRALLIVQTILYFSITLGITVIASVLCGNTDMYAPVQSIYGMSSFPYSFSVLQYLFFFMFCKYISVLACSAAVFVTVRFSTGLLSASLLCLGQVLFHFFMANSTNLWIRSLSLIRISQTASYLNRCVYLNFFLIPLRQFIPAAVFLLICLLIPVCTCALSSPENKQASFIHHTEKDRSFPSHSFAWESRKLFVYSGAWMIVFLLCAVQFGRYYRMNLMPNRQEYIYRQYSRILEGEKSPEKDAYIDSEQKRFEELHEKYEQYMAMTDLSEEDRVMLTAEISAALDNEIPFQRALNHYQSLQEYETYVYETGYETLYGPIGKRQGILNMILVMGCMIAVISKNHTLDTDHDMDCLIQAYGNREKVRRNKNVLYILLTCILCFPAFLPFIILVSKQIGISSFFSPVRDVAVFAQIPPSWPIGVFLFLTVCALCAVCCILSVLFSLSIQKIRKISVSFGIGSVCILLPLLILYMLN